MVCLCIWRSITCKGRGRETSSATVGTNWRSGCPPNVGGGGCKSLVALKSRSRFNFGPQLRGKRRQVKCKERERKSKWKRRAKEKNNFAKFKIEKALPVDDERGERKNGLSESCLCTCRKNNHSWPFTFALIGDRERETERKGRTCDHRTRRHTNCLCTYVSSSSITCTCASSLSTRQRTSLSLSLTWRKASATVKKGHYHRLRKKVRQWEERGREEEEEGEREGTGRKRHRQWSSMTSVAVASTPLSFFTIHPPSSDLVRRRLTNQTRSLFAWNKPWLKFNLHSLWLSDSSVRSSRSTTSFTFLSISFSPCLVSTFEFVVRNVSAPVSPTHKCLWMEMQSSRQRKRERERRKEREKVRRETEGEGEE